MARHVFLVNEFFVIRILHLLLVLLLSHGTEGQVFEESIFILHLLVEVPLRVHLLHQLFSEA